MSIGNRLKELRVLKGLTQEELADRAELSKGFISQVERDLTSPSIATLTDILQCLGTSLSEFFVRRTKIGRRGVDAGVGGAGCKISCAENVSQLPEKQDGTHFADP